MTIRIDRIKVNRAGPLNQDFELAPGDLNLIYGHNETGKTYIVETMINLLFRTGSRSPGKWDLREWDLGGSIIVSGLEDNGVSFTKTGKKLEDNWEEGPGLPMDLSRLLVVRAGETVLAEGEADGVGRNTLKNYLSGEGLLDKIAARISTTLQSTTVQDRIIVGAQRGEVKTRIEYKERLDTLNDFLRDVEEVYASGDIYSLQQKKEAIEAELKNLEKAKRYYGSQLYKQIQDVRLKKDGLPGEEELSDIEADIRIHDLKEAEAETKSSKLNELEGTSEDYIWTEKALDDYSVIISKPAVSRLKTFFLLILLIFFAGMLVTGFSGLNIPFIICSIGALVFFILYYIGTTKALVSSGESTELENLKADFRTRFGAELTNKAMLEAQLDKLKENHIQARALREEVEKLNLEIESRKKSITRTLKTFTGAELPPQQWRDSIKKTRTNIKEIDDEVQSLDGKRLSLAVPEEEYLNKHPGAEWDSIRYDKLEQELADNVEALAEEIARLDQLKARIIQEIHSKSTEWEDLITELRDKREQAAEAYRESTAEILAQVNVNTAIKEFREEENTRIADGLKRNELTKPLHSLTGRYIRITQAGDSGLVLTTDEDVEYPLADLSTGAREQVFFALRIGFAAIALGRQSAFLMLDDAFQHSDWNHRKNLIAETVNLVKTGWQVFYFAMDDHIRDLFLKAGGALGDGFKSLELS
jgi:uncharacterized protein YhaN